MTDILLKSIAALVAIADGLNNVASAINKNGLAVPVQSTLELKSSEPASGGSVSPSLDRLKEQAAKNTAKTPETPKAPETPKTPEPAKTTESTATDSAKDTGDGDKPATAAQLRLVGTALVADGKKTEFLKILADHGGNNVTSIPDDKKSACLAALEKALGKKVCQLED